MGATTFSSVALGKTPTEAFHNAVETARWEHGNLGYTGSVCEKPGFVLFQIPKGTRCSAYKFIGLVGDAEEMSESEYLKDSLQYARSATEKRKLEAQIRKEERKSAAWWKKLNPALAAEVKRAAPVYHDKWEACVAVEVTGTEAAKIKVRNGRKGTHDKVFLFAGYASC
jgi:hypothetical protein